VAHHAIGRRTPQKVTAKTRSGGRVGDIYSRSCGLAGTTDRSGGFIAEVPLFLLSEVERNVLAMYSVVMILQPQIAVLGQSQER
jgi:non-canonical (house-cleaning) NTP pyrophosphatase